MPTPATRLSSSPRRQTVGILNADNFVRVASTHEVPEGTFVEVEIGDEVLVVAHVESGFHAVSAWCTHQGTSLALGTLNGYVIQCWAHLWRFDVRSGEPVWPQMARVAPGYRLRVHEVRVEGDDILVSAIPRLGRLG
jgi:nitrite reductase/ring-hydroxylating ferredoxin subunit